MNLNRKINTIILNGDRILNKYDNDYIKDSNHFIGMLDRYLLHALEEVYEARTAETEEEFYSEIVDIINYTATILSIIYHNTDDNEIKSINTTFEIPERMEYSVEDFKNKKLPLIYDLLISIRRYFPQRKWHKNEPMNDTFQNILSECERKCLEVISILIFRCGYWIIDECINKQVKILNLPKVK